MLGTCFFLVLIPGTQRRPLEPEAAIVGPCPYRVDINTASVEELRILPGIGEKLADRILLYRRENGPFRIPNDMLKVKGIGPKKLEAIQPFLLAPNDERLRAEQPVDEGRI